MIDVAIAGAGPVGATLALALAGGDLDVVVVDAREAGKPAHDRTLGLSHGTRLVFERVGAWTRLAATPGAVTPITAIDVSQARGFGSVRLDAADHALPALGYVVSYRALQQVLDEALAHARIPVTFGSAVQRVDATQAHGVLEIDATRVLEARLAVVADGAATSIDGIARRHHDYRQVAIVTKVTIDHPQHGVAYERFTPEGPVALMPERDHYAVIWTCRPLDADRLLALPDADFIAALATHFGARVRRFTSVAERRGFPLALDVARNTTLPHLVVVGNAAQALHPIAAQGFNLGLRDAYDLARTIVETPRADIGSPAMLERYRKRRAIDRGAGIAFTHGLVQLFGNDWPWLRIPRGVGMMLLDTLPIAKRAFGRAMLFGAR
ncbi:MAG TPA: FAD-dependent monooxygenase [Casimicrobiaceae bacterium]|nr:FAD-dependent monooxygenase [Casimicrobiaceae bacterium]